ncbi:aromatic acid/H+ symport family MFS transporter, partial [Pseudomonas aeruginosa]
MNLPSPPAVEGLDVQALLKAPPLSPVQWRVVMPCFLIVFLDGPDPAGMGFIARALTQGWGIGRASLGPGMSGALI